MVWAGAIACWALHRGFLCPQDTGAGSQLRGEAQGSWAQEGYVSEEGRLRLGDTHLTLAQAGEARATLTAPVLTLSRGPDQKNVTCL